MAKRKGRGNRGKMGIVSFVLLLLIAVALYFAYPYITDFLGSIQEGSTTITHQKIPVGDDEYIEVHIIDVGQGDSILVRTAGGDMLIDAGPGSAEDELKEYLTSIDVKDIEYAVFTHPHEDHIGGADMVMTDFTVSNVIIPDVQATTVTYTRMMDAITASGAQIVTPVSGDEYTLGSMTATVLGPISQKYSNVNNYSVIMRLEFGDTSFMMTGDAEKEAEAEVLEKFKEELLKCDVLKVGHHGSDTATSPAFLSAVSPRIAVISCGVGNTYGHPHSVTLSKLIEAGVTTYRTDEVGSVILVSDGKTVTVKSK